MMEESIYDTINNRIIFFNETFAAISVNKLYHAKLHEKYNQIDHLKITLEIDQFVKEYPENNIYLEEFLRKYEKLNKSIKNFLKSNEKPQNEPFNQMFKSDISKIIEHLKGLLNPESDIQEPPQKFEKLKPFEKILIFHYLNGENKLFKYPLNSKSGKYFLSRLLDINPDSIKNPVNNISDYTTNKVTQKQAESFCKILEKVKLFFDKSDLNEISKVIETRINELKRISGKD
jgi:hypothetical protein